MKEVKIANDIDSVVKETLEESIIAVIKTEGVSKLSEIIYNYAGLGVTTEIIQEINEGGGILQ